MICLIMNFSYTGKAQKVDSTNNTAKKSFKDKLEIIELITNESDKNKIDDYEIVTNTVIFLERLTNLKSNLFEGYDPLYEPSRENYEDWKSWFKLNKAKLYMDGDTVKTNTNHVAVKKNPKIYFKKKLKLVKKSLRKQEYNDPEYSNAVQFLVDLTDIITICLDPELNIATPCEKDILYFETWFKKNKNNLYWDVKTHSVQVN